MKIDFTTSSPFLPEITGCRTFSNPIDFTERNTYTNQCVSPKAVRSQADCSRHKGLLSCSASQWTFVLVSPRQVNKLCYVFILYDNTFSVVL